MCVVVRVNKTKPNLPKLNIIEANEAMDENTYKNYVRQQQKLQQQNDEILGILPLTPSTTPPTPSPSPSPLPTLNNDDEYDPEFDPDNVVIRGDNAGHTTDDDDENDHNHNYNQNRNI